MQTKTRNQILKLFQTFKYSLPEASDDLVFGLFGLVWDETNRRIQKCQCGSKRCDSYKKAHSTFVDTINDIQKRSLCDEVHGRDVL